MMLKCQFLASSVCGKRLATAAFGNSEQLIDFFKERKMEEPIINTHTKMTKR